jgi:hypothetical protein
MAGNWFAMRVDVASRAPHGRKHGSTFAETWQAHDRTTIVAVGAVLAGRDRVVVGDLLKVGVRTVVTGGAALHAALVGLDKLVTSHAREHRDDELAASVVLLGFDRGGLGLTVAGAGRLAATIVSGTGAFEHAYSRAGALGTGIEPEDATETLTLRPDDLVVAATVAIDPRWWPAGDRSAHALLAHATEPEASAAVVVPR